MSVFIYGIENGLLMIPILYLYVNVRERHEFLESTIGATHLEKEAMETTWILAVYSICSVVSLVLIQIFLLLAYNLYGHPWKRFLTTDIQGSGNGKIETPTKLSMESDVKVQGEEEKEKIDSIPTKITSNVSVNSESKSLEPLPENIKITDSSSNDEIKKSLPEEKQELRGQQLIGTCLEHCDQSGDQPRVTTEKEDDKLLSPELPSEDHVTKY